MKGVSTFYRKKKDGSLSWAYRLSIASVDGKRNQPSKSGFKSKNEAEKAGIKALLEYENTGQIISSSNISFADFLDIWIEKDCAIYLKQQTINTYKKRIENHIKPALGTYRLRSINRENLQSLIVDMFNKGYSRNTLTSISALLSKSLNWAIDNNYLVFSPAIRIKIPKNITPETPTRASERLYICAESMEKISNRFPENQPSHIPLKIGYECGMRIGEVFALVWEDIDLERQTITVNRQFQWEGDKTRTEEEKLLSNGKTDCGGGYWYFTNPKYNSFRVIDISSKLTELLLREQSRQKAMREYYGDEYTNYFANYPPTFEGEQNNKNSIMNPINIDKGNPISFVLVRADGTYISSRTMQHTTRVIKSIIPESFKFHDLRHTHISMLYENNVNEIYIQGRTGHKSLYMTKYYIRQSDISNNHGKSAIQNIFG